MRPQPGVAIIGAGPGGLMAADRLAAAGCKVTVYERMPAVARKFLLAGRGGLNLTHSEPIERLLQRYGSATPAIEAALRAFPADALVAWCEALGVETFVGTSGRIFPKSLKASPLLRAWLRRLAGAGVRIELRHRWTGFSGDGGLSFDTPDGPKTVQPDAGVLALGGASWPRLGSDGSWVAPFEAIGVSPSPLRPANCGFVVAWSEHFSGRHAGEPLKRVAMTFRGRSERGEAMVTRDGIEGGVIYAFSAALREAIARDGEARPTLDLRPDLPADALAAKLSAGRGSRSLSTHLKKAAGLTAVAISLLREGGAPPADPAALAAAIKAVPLRLTATKGIERAISTAGGVRFEELDAAFMLKARPGVFLAGEMLDWEAPTGGYLLQATFATSVAAAGGAVRWLTETRTD